MSCVRRAAAKVVKEKRHIINRFLSPSSSTAGTGTRTETIPTAPFFSGGTGTESIAKTNKQTSKLNPPNSTDSLVLLGSKFSDQHWRIDPRLWFFLSGNAAIILAINSNTVLAKDASLDNEVQGMEGDDTMQLRRVEDASVKSNIHTSKWRVFTDKGREFFLQGKVEEAEKLFLAALQEAKEGFGKRDPHVASASNNLAELYRVNKLYHKAEPLYLEAISILEESFGPEDIRVGSAFHNLGQFYIVQRKLDEARVCYERALKIKRRVLGLNHTGYADTMYHLGTVLHLQGKEKDSEALVQDSIRILEVKSYC